MTGKFRTCVHYFRFCLQFIYFLLILLKNVAEGALEDDDLFHSSYHIEPTPVFIQGPISSYYTIGLIQEQKGDFGDGWHMGSGREKRDYNLEDFLIWMPSGDGPVEYWSQKPKITEWISQYTKTIYVTKTKYETLFLSTSKNIYQTTKVITPMRATTNYFGKDIHGSFSTGYKIPTYLVSPPDFSAEQENGSEHQTNKKKMRNSFPVDLGSKLHPTSKSTYFDIGVFLHSSLGYDGPLSSYNQYTSSVPTPIMVARGEETIFQRSANSVSSELSSSFGCKIFDMVTNLHSITKEMPFSTKSMFYASTEQINSLTKEISSDIIYMKVTTEDVLLVDTTETSLTTNLVTFPFSELYVTNVTSIPLFGSTPTENSIKVPSDPIADNVTEETPTEESNFADVVTLNISNTTSCNCNVTSNENITLPTNFNYTLQIPSALPSPSNNATPPIAKKTWIRTVMHGAPANSNKDEFKNEMTTKLATAYKYAFKLPSTKNNSGHWIAKINNGGRKYMAMVVTSTDGTIKKSRPKRNLFRRSNKNAIKRTNVVRMKRQTSLNVSVRMQNVTYVPEPNITELVYSVFMGDNPLSAEEAVDTMRSANTTVVEKIIGYALAVKAEEYVRPVKLVDERSKTFYVQIFSLVAGVTGFIFLTAFFIWKFAKYKRKRAQSREELGNLESNSHTPRSNMNSETGIENQGFNETHDSESIPETSRRTSPEVADLGVRSFLPHLPGPSMREPVPYPRSNLLPSSRRKDSEDGAQTWRRPKSAEELEYSLVDHSKPKKLVDEKFESPEHKYSIPKPVSQYHENIQYAQSKIQDFIPGTSLPKFLPPPRPPLPLLPDPSIASGPQLPPRNNPIIDEHDWSGFGENKLTDPDLQFAIQGKRSFDHSSSGQSKGSSELETLPDSPTVESVVGISRLRRRFHDLLDDAFSLMHGQKPGDKVTPLTTPFHSGKPRSRSAMPQNRPRLLDDLEGSTRSFTPERTNTYLRPKSAAAMTHSPRELISILPSAESAEGSPRSAWGDQGRRSITPVNLPTPRFYDRPDSATLSRAYREGPISPVPKDPETGLRLYDPAVPLIRAIKDELNRFKTTVNTDSSNA